MTRYLTRYQTYYCDFPWCKDSFEECGTARAVWIEARREGWSASGGQHFCPWHSQQPESVEMGCDQDAD